MSVALHYLYLPVPPGEGSVGPGAASMPLSGGRTGTAVEGSLEPTYRIERNFL